MLAKSVRLTSRVEEPFFLTAKSWGMGWTRVYWESRDWPGPKIALIVPKKSFPLSVTRHKARRKASRMVAEFIRAVPLPPGQYAFVVRASVLEAEPEQMQADLDRWVVTKFADKTEPECGKIEEIETKAVHL